MPTLAVTFLDADVRQYATKALWLAGRGECIGSSDAASLYDAVPTTREQMLSRKLGMEPEWESTTEQNAGHEAERLLLIRRAEKVTVAQTPLTIAVSRKWPWMSASPDGIEFDGDGNIVAIVECKATKRLIEWDPTAKRWSTINWNRGHRPLRWVVQAQHLMAVTGINRVISPTLIGSELRIEDGVYERNDAWIEKHVEKCRAAWLDLQSLSGRTP